MAEDQKVILTGATGYIGSHLLEKLRRENVKVRCLVRDKSKLEGDVVESDLLIDPNLVEKLKGFDQAIYLIHSLESGSYEEMDKIIAERFARACVQSGIKRIIYLGGLSHPDYERSPHLKSRQDTGKILAEFPLQVIELRASVVIGPGSISYEMICALTDRLPVMIIPKWVRTPLQPISIGEVVEYLYQSVLLPFGPSKIYEIGGKDVTTYQDLMQEYADLKGLKRLMVPVPVLTPFLSSLWLGLVTPIYANVGRKLIESATVPTVVTNKDALNDFHVIPLKSYDSLAGALKEEVQSVKAYSWRRRDKLRNYLVDARSIEIPVSPEEAFKPIVQIGGEKGWYYANFLWEIRGLIDKIMGGPGLRRGRVDPDSLQEGQYLDFWKVLSFIPNQRLLLLAEMKVPGEAYLCFEVVPVPGGSKIYQTAIFRPNGLFGICYWYLLLPIHRLMFKGMLKAIAASAYKETK